MVIDDDDVADDIDGFRAGGCITSYRRASLDVFKIQSDHNCDVLFPLM